MTNELTQSIEGQSVEGVQQVEFRAMGSQILAAVQSGSAAAGEALAQVAGWFTYWERSLSRFDETSELCRLNRTCGNPTPTPVSGTLWRVLQLALRAAEDTGGLVTPTVLASLEAAGYAASFHAMRPGVTFLEGARAGTRQAAAADWRGIKLYPNTHSVRLPAGVRLDLGGIAKGWAADEALSRLAEYGPALVDAGGDIAVSGPRLEGGWPIGVDAPLRPGQAHDGEELGAPLDLLWMAGGGVATSGRDYRRWQLGGAWQHHIIDPRTSLPADTNVMSSTVIAPTAGQAEVGAKVALLLGSTAGLAWLEAQPTLAGLLALENGEVVRSRRFADYIWSNRYGNRQILGAR